MNAQKNLVARALKRRMEQAPVEIEVEERENPDSEAPEMALEEDEPSLREQLNAEPLVGGGEGEEGEPVDMDAEMYSALSDRGQGGNLIQRVLQTLAAKSKARKV